MAAAPCTNVVASDTAMPARSPSQAEPVMAATAPAAKAAASILPSRPMSKMPARSEYMPARHASSSGVDRRMVASRMERMAARSISALRLGGRHRNGFRLLLGRHQHEGAFERGTEQPLHGAGKEDHQSLDDDDHFAGNAGNYELQLLAPLV